MEEYIQISKLNDFVFCPYSLYLHSIYDQFSQKIYHSVFQTRGKLAHSSIDSKKYTTSKKLLQGIGIYSEKLGLAGKIDLFDLESGYLIERKYKVKKIFDGYRFQLYAQMYCLQEMGYAVKKLYIHSLSDNSRYEVKMPDKTEEHKFKLLVKEIKEYIPGRNIIKSKNKCDNCIYRNLCH